MSLGISCDPPIHSIANEATDKGEYQDDKYDALIVDDHLSVEAKGSAYFDLSS